MSRFRIEGGRPLSGCIRVQGSKNSVLPILAGTLLVPGKSVIRNCPDLSDVSAALEILKLLGCEVEREGDEICVDAKCLKRDTIDPELMATLRSSVVFFYYNKFCLTISNILCNSCTCTRLIVVNKCF